MKNLSKIILIWTATTLLAQAADFRIWTSNRGTSIEAQLMKYKDGSVKVVTKEPKELVLKVTDLCLADRQYLIDYADAKPDVVLKGEPSVPELAYKKPKSFLTKLDKTLRLGDGELINFDLYETEHYMFAVGKGVRVTGIAETAEACWHGMAFQHYEFRENWGSTKQLVIIPAEAEEYTELGKIEVAALQAVGKADRATNTQLTWPKLGAGSMGVPDDAAEEFNVKERALVYAPRDPKLFRRKFNSFHTHSISRSLFGVQVGGVSSVSTSGYFALSTGHAYYKEIQLTKKTQTNMIASDYESELTTKSGFDDGSSWPKILKGMVKKGKIKPNLTTILGIKSPNELTPETLVTMYSLSCYMQSTQAHIASYAKLARLINTSDQIPETTEMVKLFGFDTIEDFEKGWTEFVTSKDFR